MKRSFRFVAAVLALAIVIVPAAVFAQQTESRITGRVLDDSKAAMPGVTVTVTSKSTGAVRTAVTGGDGTYTVTNLGPGTYTVAFELSGFASQSRDVVLGVGQVETVDVTLGVASLQEAVTVSAESNVHRHVLGAHRRQRVARGSRQPAGERPQLREPDDAGHRRDERRQRRLGQRALQRQVEPAELPELRRRRRHLRVGREPRLPERHRLAVPPADVDGVGRGVPRQLRPRAGRKRPRRRRQHHRRQQERHATRSAARSSNTSATTRSTRRASTTTRSSRSSSTSSADRSAARLRRNRTFFFGSFEGAAAEDRPELHRGGAERRGAPPDSGGRAGRHRRRPESRRARRPWRRCWPASRRARRRPVEPAARARHARTRRRSRTRTACRCASITASATRSRSTCAISSATASSTRRIGR